MKKCVLIHCGLSLSPRSSRLIRRLLASLGNGADAIGLVRHARYLGVQIGPEGWKHAWGTALLKFHQRCIGIRRLRIGLAMTIRTHVIFAVSVP
eukprot:7932427-Pyramimonas_sp.AAC.1